MNRETAEPTVSEIPDERAQEWVEHHHDHAAKTTYVYGFVWDHTADAAGPFCTDVDGNVLLDFTSHVAAAPLGYDNPELADRMAEFDVPDPTKIAGQDFYVASGSIDDHPFPNPSDLMDRLTDVSSHYDMETVFLSNSGAEAVENSIKICYDHTGSDYAITFEGAFHGRTLGALSLNRSKSVYRRDYPEVPKVHDIPFCVESSCTPDTCSCGFFGSERSQLRRMLDPETGYVDPDDVAYVILEPIQGEGGYRFPSDDFMREVADVTDEHDIPIVADEIQSGVGRTGEFWGSDHYAIEPDVIASAKGLRVGATIGRGEVFPDEKGRISSTWGAGDLVAAMQGALTVDIIHDLNLMDNAVEQGERFKSQVREADPAGVDEVRGKGLMLAVDYESNERRDDAVEAMMKRGLLTLACGHTVQRILPPLDVREREIDMAVDLLVETLDDLA